jgi:hypothetical protein
MTRSSAPTATSRVAVMSARTLARIIAIGRVVFGGAIIVAPRLVGRPWVGSDADRPGATVFARGLGVRDVVLGMVALHTLDHPEVGPRWQRTLAACDAVDCAATLAAREARPKPAVIGSAVTAAATAAAELWAAQRLRS